MNKEEERKYVFAQLSSLPNAFQYVSVTNYIKNLEQQNQKYKEAIDKIEKIMHDHTTAENQLDEIEDILKEVE